jgi:entry exclusion lipoprotein TrbK
MKSSKALALALAALVAASVAGCDNKPAVQPLPEVTDANCTPEKIKIDAAGAAARVLIAVPAS